MSVAAQTTRSIPLLRRRSAVERPRWLILVALITFAVLIIPLAMVVVYSFNSLSSLGSFGSLSTRWYDTLFHDSVLLDSVWASARIAAATAVVATLLGTGLGISLSRTHRAVSRPVAALLLLTLVTPEIGSAVALLLMLDQFHFSLSLVTVALGHITFSLIYVTVLVRTMAERLSPEVERAGLDLGATEFEVLRLVILPQLRSAIIGAAILAFVLSFDDFILSVFLTGVGSSPLPVVIYGELRVGLTPEIDAVGCLLIACSLIVGLGATVLFRRRAR